MFGGLGPITVHSTTGLGDTPLHVAVRRGDAEIVADMLDAGADINVRGETGFTPLHTAVTFDDVAMVELLLGRGASLLNVNDWNESLADTVARRGVRQIVDAFNRARASAG